MAHRAYPKLRGTAACPVRDYVLRRSGQQLSRSTDTARPSPMEDIRSPSLKRKSPSLDPNSSSGRKSRANGERSAKHRRVSYPSDEPALPFPDSTPPSTQPRDTFSSKGKLFGKDNGEPYTFFVQIDLRPRTKIADAIKVRMSNVSAVYASIRSYLFCRNMEAG